MNEKLKDVMELMDAVINDTSVPRNIRAAIDEARQKVLNEKEEITIRISSAIYVLDDISNDINMPAHARTDIWTIISELEAIKEESKEE